MHRRAAKPLRPFVVALPGALGWWSVGAFVGLGQLDLVRGSPSLVIALVLLTLAGLLWPASIVCLVLACRRPRERWLALFTNGSFFLLPLPVFFHWVP